MSKRLKKRKARYGFPFFMRLRKGLLSLKFLNDVINEKKHGANHNNRDKGVPILEHVLWVLGLKLN